MASIATIIAVGLLAYVVLGLLFAAPFVARGIERVDPAARGAGLGFRLIVLPGVAALWPLLFVRWLRSRR
jgi:hypothetical protein